MTVTTFDPAGAGKHDPVEVLARVPLFAGLEADVLARLAQVSKVTRAPRGTRLFAQGDEARALHVLLDGQVGLFAKVEDEGEDTLLEILDAGEAFIAAAMLTGKPYLMTGSALTPIRVLEVPRQALLDDLRASPDLALAMLGSLARHYRQLVQEVKELKLTSASQRLARYLLGLTPRRRGAVIVRLPHNKGLIAARVGVRPETLSRAFAQLRGEGVVVDGHNVAIADLHALGLYCHDGREVV
ncbi:MAG: cyclic nucleotide-binding domain-containing protein [Magnetospirillum sp.]|nr:cyclic nucleotide-binding domain-containing protein [Magnetospirillum sp.]